MLEKVEQQVVDDIATHGWHGVHVLEDEAGPGFCYSIGLDDMLGAPELIVFGLKRPVMHAMIWEMTRQIQAGRTISPDAVFNYLIEGFPCIVKPVHPSRRGDYFGYAGWYYHYRRKLGRFQAFQIFWPGKLDGLFPWQPGCADEVKAAQPLLYEAMIEQSGA